VYLPDLLSRCSAHRASFTMVEIIAQMGEFFSSTRLLAIISTADLPIAALLFALLVRTAPRSLVKDSRLLLTVLRLSSIPSVWADTQWLIKNDTATLSYLLALVFCRTLATDGSIPFAKWDPSGERVNCNGSIPFVLSISCLPSQRI
jgi:hypothetical protein